MWMLVVPSEDTLQTRDARIEGLLAGMADGDREALGKLYELIKTDLYAFALSRGISRTDAEDLMHDTFVAIFRAAPQYRPMGKPMAWILTVEHNLIRRSYRAAPTVSYEEAVGEDTEASDTEEVVAKRELLRTLLATLGEGEREVVILHAVTGLRHREIAALLGRSLSGVLSTYNRAIKKLQKKLTEGGEAP